MQILLIEDEISLAESIAKGLRNENFLVDIANDGQKALSFLVNKYDLVILDLMLPKVSGLEILEWMREKEKTIPVIILTAKNSVEDKISGLNLGADDYLSKPFDFNELLARINALIRRASKSSPLLEVDNLILNPQTKNVQRRGEDVKLSATEYRLLEYLMHHAGEVLSETDLLEHVWDHSYDGLSNIVAVYIGYLRKKIDKQFPKEAPLVKTLKGLGYSIKK